MNATQLKGDLKEIEDAIGRSTADQAVKRLLGEVVEWSRGLVDQINKDTARVDGLEAAVDDLLEGVEEGIAAETAQVLLTAYEQSRHVFVTIAAFLDSDKNPLDDVTTKNFKTLIAAAAKSVSVAVDTVQEIVIEEADDAEEADEDEEDEEAALEEDEVDEDEEDANA